MSMLRNSVRLIGFLGTDPEVKKISEETTLARFPIATHSRYMNKAGEWVTETQWHNLIMWNSQANFAEKFLTKGSEIALHGRLINRSYTDKTGAIQYVTEVSVSDLTLLNKKDPEE